MLRFEAKNTLRRGLEAPNSSDFTPKEALLWLNREKDSPRRPSGSQKSLQDRENGAKIKVKLSPKSEKYVIWSETIFCTKFSSENVRFSWEFVEQNVKNTLKKQWFFILFHFSYIFHFDSIFDWCSCHFELQNPLKIHSISMK